MVTEIISDHTENLMPRAQLLFLKTSADTRVHCRIMGVERLVKPHPEHETQNLSKTLLVVLIIL